MGVLEFLLYVAAIPIGLAVGYLLILALVFMAGAVAGIFLGIYRVISAKLRSNK